MANAIEPVGEPVVKHIDFYEQSKSLRVTFQDGTHEDFAGENNYFEARAAMANMTLPVPVAAQDLALKDARGDGVIMILTPKVTHQAFSDR